MLAAPGGVSRAELERGRDLAELADLTDSGMLESTDTLPGGEGGCVVYTRLFSMGNTVPTVPHMTLSATPQCMYVVCVRMHALIVLLDTMQSRYIHTVGLWRRAL